MEMKMKNLCMARKLAGNFSEGKCNIDAVP